MAPGPPTARLESASKTTGTAESGGGARGMEGLFRLLQVWEPGEDPGMAAAAGQVLAPWVPVPPLHPRGPCRLFGQPAPPLFALISLGSLWLLPHPRHAPASGPLHARSLHGSRPHLLGASGSDLTSARTLPDPCPGSSCSPRASVSDIAHIAILGFSCLPRERHLPEGRDSVCPLLPRPRRSDWPSEQAWCSVTE